MASADGYTLASAVCELVAPVSYRSNDRIFGGQLVFHAFRVKGPPANTERAVLFASNHRAVDGSGLTIAVSPEAIALGQGLPSGSSLADPITMATPGAEEAVACAREAGSPPSLTFRNLDVEAWRAKAIHRFGPEERHRDGSKDDYVRFALSLCTQSAADRTVMQTNLGTRYEGSFQRFVIDTFCPNI